MKFWLKIITPVLALVAASCHGSAPEADSDVLKAVPSRAVAVAHFGRLDKALSLLTDSTSVLRQIDFGSLHSNEATISWVYSANLVPVLAVEAGRGTSDISSVAAKVMARAQEQGLHCSYTGDALKRAILIISPLQSVVDEAQAHIDAQTSILDAPGFADASKLAEGEAGTLFLSGQATRRWLPKGFLKGIFPRIATASMTASFSEWFVADFDSYSTEKISVKYLQDPSGYHYSKVIESTRGGDVKLASFLPEDYSLFVDFPVGNAVKYMEAWSSYLDVKALLHTNRINSKIIERSCGISPMAWAAKLNIKEVALVARFRPEASAASEPQTASKVLLVRAGKKSGLPAVAGKNECPGGLEVLFGRLFRLEDESFCAPVGRWLVIGAERDVLPYIEDAGKLRLPDLPKSDCNFAICTPDWQIACAGGKIGLRKWN